MPRRYFAWIGYPDSVTSRDFGSTVDHSGARVEGLCYDDQPDDARCTWWSRVQRSVIQFLVLDTLRDDGEGYTDRVASPRSASPPTNPATPCHAVSEALSGYP